MPFFFRKFKTLRLFPKSTITAVGEKKLTENAGQTFIEFLFLLFILVAISYTMLGLVNRKVGDRWVQLVSLISSDNPKSPRTDIDLN